MHIIQQYVTIIVRIMIQQSEHMLRILPHVGTINKHFLNTLIVNEIGETILV